MKNSTELIKDIAKKVQCATGVYTDRLLDFHLYLGKHPEHQWRFPKNLHLPVFIAGIDLNLTFIHNSERDPDALKKVSTRIITTGNRLEQWIQNVGPSLSQITPPMGAPSVPEMLSMYSDLALDSLVTCVQHAENQTPIMVGPIPFYPSSSRYTARTMALLSLLYWIKGEMPNGDIANLFRAPLAKLQDNWNDLSFGTPFVIEKDYKSYSPYDSDQNVPVHRSSEVCQTGNSVAKTSKTGLPAVLEQLRAGISEHCVFQGKNGPVSVEIHEIPVGNNVELEQLLTAIKNHFDDPITDALCGPSWKETKNIYRQFFKRIKRLLNAGYDFRQFDESMREMIGFLDGFGLTALMADGTCRVLKCPNDTLIYLRQLFKRIVAQFENDWDGNEINLCELVSDGDLEVDSLRYNENVCVNDISGRRANLRVVANVLLCCAPRLDGILTKAEQDVENK